MTTLTNLEKAVLSKLLDGDHPVLALLRQQVKFCRCSKREMTGVGFYTELNVGTFTGPRPELDLTFGDVDAEIDGLQFGAGFVLYVESGLLVMLEGYTFGEPWPDRIDEFQLSYTTGGERDMIALVQFL